VEGREEEGRSFELPQDRRTALFVLSMAANSVMYRMYTPERYKNEVLSQEVTGLTRLSRDIEAAYNRRLAAEKRLIGRITEIGGEKLLRRPPNWFVVLVALFTTLFVVAYGNYSGQIYAWEAWAYLYQGYIIATLLFVLAVVIMLRLRRRKKQ
jgi:hypothetical protein